MLLEAIYHRPKQNWAFAYDAETVYLRIRAKRGDVARAEVLYGDKFAPWEQMQTMPMRKFASDSLFDYWETAVKPPFRRLSYGFVLHQGEQVVWYTEKGPSAKPPAEHMGLFEYPFLHAAEVFQPPAWVKDAVFYQIFPERFCNGDPSNDPERTEPWDGKPECFNFFGGDLQGVIDKLDYLTELGITALYFTPIFEAPSNHKYDTTDYLKVDPQFGTNDTLKQLVKECHKRGIRVLLDAVFNHCGYKFAPFVDVLEKGPASPYADWFHIREFPESVDENGVPEVGENGLPTFDAFAFTPMMPKLKTEHPEVKAYLLKVARYWIEECDIDGWRLDVANEVDHRFWREFRDTVKSAKPDAYILGEIFHDSMMWLQGDQFDSVMNYPFAHTVLDFFAKGTLDAYEFANAIQQQMARYPKQATEVMFNLLDSHDTARLLSQCRQDKRIMKLAALFQLTYTGTPCIYYGDEIGMTGGNDPDCRKCMIWEPERQDRELFAFYQRLIALRKRVPALRTGEFRFLLAERNDTRLVYERSDAHHRVIVAMNPTPSARTASCPAPNGSWRDAFTSEAVEIADGRFREELPAYGFRLLIREQ